MREVYAIRNYVNNGGKYSHKLDNINKFVLTQFKNSRDKKLPIHDIDLKRWANVCAKQLNIKFNVSNYWVSKFKKANRIRSRKVTKFVSYNNLKDSAKLIDTCNNFVKNAINQFKNYENSHILNTDQSGFCYELYSNRTLSEIGEKHTVVCADSLNAISHSYTIQPLISFEGKLVGKLYICLQESKDTFGPNVLKNLQIPENVVVTCSKSGKLTKPLVKKYINDILKPVVSKDFILMVDSWTTHKDKSLYDEIFDDIKCNLLVIPSGCTSLIQPADKILFREWKYFVKHFYNYVSLEEIDIELRVRNCIIKMQSLIYNQLQSPLFYRMLRYAWHKPGYCNDNVEFDNVRDICFNYLETNCNINNCNEETFIQCSHCRKYICFTHFFVESHFHQIE
jgi:hypothetical protein